jgi:hypothetical protein
MSQRIKEHIAKMTRDEKYEEFRFYLRVGGILNLDIDRIKADEQMQGATPSAVDEALLRCATVSGSLFGREPLTAQELYDTIKTRPDEACDWFRRFTPPKAGPVDMPASPLRGPFFSLRKSVNRNE